MKQYIKLTLLIIFICINFSCDIIYTEKIKDNYYLTSLKKNLPISISYKLENGDYIGVVPEHVYEYSICEGYILAKQGILSTKNPKSIIDSNQTKYFIIPLNYKVNKSPDENKIGPLNKEDFYKKLNSLQISDTLIYLSTY